MNKKDVIKAFFAGVFSLTPVFSFFSTFKPVNVNIREIESSKSSVPSVKVNLRPVMEDVGDCFNDVGNKMRASMLRLTSK